MSCVSLLSGLKKNKNKKKKKKKKRVSANMPKKIRVGSGKSFYFLSHFCMLEKDKKKMFIGAKYHLQYLKT